MSIPTWGHRENPAKNRSTFHVSKSTAVKWVTLGTHEPVDHENMKAGIQAVDPTKKRAIRHTVAYTAYIPAEIPPDNIDKSLGVRFIPPPNAPRRQRQVAVMSRGEFVDQYLASNQIEINHEA
jgi:hypothetical protein